MGVSLEQFVEHLTASGLMSATEVNAFQETLPLPKPKDGETLAQELVQANRLTKYQAEAICQGRGKGLVFGEYRALDKLGQGGMGVVLKAEHRRMKRLVAVKMIAGPALRSPDAVKRFYREVEAAAKLNHPNIVQAYDASEHEGVHYLVMEYVDGRDLDAIVKERGPLPVVQAVECIVQAARGLEYAHKQGIVHRDIKPANLLVDQEGTVKILDMGLARVAGLADEDDKDRLTSSGQVMGTCDYMAPEQALDTRSADPRADIYALGCTFFRLLTGAVPYKGETLMQILWAHQRSPIPSLRAACPEVSPQLDAVCQRMMAKRPEDRQPSMAEVIADLECCLGRRSGAAPSLAEQSAASDQVLQGVWSFLREEGVGAATYAKNRPTPSHSGTVACQSGQGKSGHPEGNGGHPERSEGSPLPDVCLRVFAAFRTTPAVALALGLVGVVAVLLTIAFRVRHPDGRETFVQAAAGSTVKVSKTGDVAVPLKAERPVDEAAPGFQGGYDPRRAAQPLSSVKSPSPQLGPDGNWRLPPGAPQPAVAPFDARKAQEHQAAWAKHLAMPIEETNSIGMKLVLIPPGEFDMGSTPEEVRWASEYGEQNKGTEKSYLERVSSEAPRHRVKITKPFYMAAYHVTQGEYERVMGINPSAFTEKQMEAAAFKPPLPKAATKYREQDGKMVQGKDTSRHPVETVNWDEAVEFCRKLSAMPAERAARRVYHLPTEAEWEYACRAGTATRWFCGDDEVDLGEVAWVRRNAGGMTHPLGEKKPNAWGLYDISGNVWQWCADWYSKDYYAQSSPSDPVGPPAGSYRVLRGGQWTSYASCCRSAYRYFYGPASRYHDAGFRVVVDR